MSKIKLLNNQGDEAIPEHRRIKLFAVCRWR